MMRMASRETVTGALTPGHSTTHHVIMMRLTECTRVVTAAALAVDVSDSPLGVLAQHRL
jgi:hypothetical protein